MVSKSKFRINVCNARHELDLLRDIINQNGYKEVHIKDSEAEVMW